MEKEEELQTRMIQLRSEQDRTIQQVRDELEREKSHTLSFQRQNDALKQVRHSHVHNIRVYNHSIMYTIFAYNHSIMYTIYNIRVYNHYRYYVHNIM